MCILLCLLPVSAGAGQAVPEADTVIATANRVADWQLAHMSDFEDYIPTFLHRTVNPRGWVQGTFLTGLAVWAAHSGSIPYFEFLRQYAIEQDWQLGARLYHADDHVVGQYYLALQNMFPNPLTIRPVQNQFDLILADPPQGSLDFGPQGALADQGYDHDCQRKWCWSDALFMSPPVWFELSKITGDPRYRDYANELYWETVDYLFDDEAGLFLRDSRFFEQRDETGGKIFWSRGNGWVFYGLTRIIDTLAAESPLRPRYIQLYRQMAEALLPLQRANGFWPVSLLDPVPEQVRESSGTAFFVAGLAWGINQGILEQSRVDNAVLRGWNGLV